MQYVLLFLGPGPSLTNAQAAIKTSALNWPEHRGTATAFPLGAFGLSAFFFSVFSQYVFPGDTGDFLMLLACGTFSMVFISFFFLRVLPHPSYSALPSNSGRDDSSVLGRTKSEESRHRVEPGKSTSRESAGLLTPEDTIEARSASESSSLLSKGPSSASHPGRVSEDDSVDKVHSHRADIRGFALLRSIEFWQLFSLMGILTGIGLMTIK